MKKVFCLIFLFQIAVFCFPQEKKEIKIDPVETYLSTHHVEESSRKIRLYEDKTIAGKYVCFLLEQGLFGAIEFTEIVFFENEEFWLVCLNKTDPDVSDGLNEDDLLISDRCDHEDYVLTFLLRKDNGEISSVIKF